MLFSSLASTSLAVAASSGRNRKLELLADCLRTAGPDDVEPAVAFLSGELLQRRTGIGWASLRILPTPAEAASLTVRDVDATFEQIAAHAGTGSQTARRAALSALLGRATPDEQRLISALVSGEIRQGALASLVLDAVARAAGLPAEDVRRAVMLRGAAGPVARAVLTEGAPGLAQFRLEVGRPVQPMLAQSSASVEAALSKLGTAAVEWKIDGVRIQAHRWGDEVRVFTRTLDDVTSRVPEVVEAVRSLPVRSIVLDGEAIALDPKGRPRPFQVTASRLGSKLDVERGRAKTPLSAFMFDVLHLDGTDLLDRTGEERAAVLAEVVPPALQVPRVVTADATEAAAFFADALKHGHEGVVLKALDQPYAAGRRGTGWIKVKPVHTLDLVVLAAEWGHGRRRGYLSNLHLGALDPATGEYVMLGKTFKGLTDELLAWQTTALLPLATNRDDWQVEVRPALVVEIAFDGVQSSSRYAGGMALRFARVVRYREDKTVEQADTIDAVRAVLAGQG